jgi:hypothetical protein
LLRLQRHRTGRKLLLLLQFLQLLLACSNRLLASCLQPFVQRG